MADGKKKSSPEKKVYDKYLKDNPLFKGADKMKKHLKDKLEQKGKKPKAAKKYKKGGSIDGCATKGLTKAKRSR